MQQPPRKSSPGLYAGYGFIVSLLILVIGAWSSLYSAQLNILLRGIQPSCSVGIGSATITIQAWSASDDCQHMLAGSDFTGVDWARLGASARSEATGAIICEEDRAGRHVTIRDSASGMGVVLCNMLDAPPPAFGR